MTIYAEYFIHRIKNDGMPNLTDEQAERMINIIHMEGIMIGTAHKGDPNKYGQERYRQTKSFNELTKRLNPQKVWEQMKKLSQ